MNTARCRVCLSENDCVRNIFTDRCSNGQSYAEALTSCLDRVVVENDATRQHICEACVSNLETWVTCGVIDDDFRSKYYSSRRQSEHTRIKVEPESEEYPQIQQRIETSTDTTVDIKIEEICLKTEPDDEYFQIIDKKDTDPLETKPLKCDRYKELGKKKKQPEDLLIRAGEKPYVCKHCGKTFRWRSNLAEHLRTHTSEKRYKCDHCEKTFVVKLYLKRHLWMHTGEKPYKCDHCEKAFCQKVGLAQHVRTHISKKQYRCDHCGKAFSWKSNLIMHLHTHTGEKRYKCDQCEKAFRDKTVLTRHLRTHTGEKPYKCDHCTKAFADKAAVMRHLRTHTGEKPFKCDHCAKAFTDKTTLVRHLRRHTGEKPFKCDHCKKSFSAKDTVTRHLQRHAIEKSYKYDQSAPGDQDAPEQKYNFDYTDTIVETVNIKTEEICLKTEPDDEYFGKKEIDPLEIKPLE